MFKIKKIFLLILLCLLSTVYFDTVSAQEEGAFSVQALLEKHQKDEKLSYWWLKVNKAEEIQLKLKIDNGDNPSTFELMANQAVNNQNFVIDYSLPNAQAATFLLKGQPSFDFTKRVKFDLPKAKNKTEIHLKPRETQLVSIRLEMPPSRLVGQVIGGINVTRKPQDSERKNGILNVYSQTVAIVLEGDKIPKGTKLKLSLGKMNNRVQSIQIKNPNQVLLQKVKVDVTLKNSSGQLVSHLNVPQTAVVPQASVRLNLESAQALKKGNYLLEVRAGQQSLIQKLQISQSGKVSLADSAKANFRDKKDLGWALSLVLLVGLSLILYLLRRVIRKK